MKSYLRGLKRSYLEHKYKKNTYDIGFFTNVLKNNPNLKSIDIEKERFILRLQNGMKFEWEPTEKYSCLGLATEKSYENFELELIKKLLNPTDVVFDIGANFGYFSVSLNLFYPNLKLYSFEPIKRTYELFLRNCLLNNIQPNSYNQGFSNENGILTFYLPEKLGSAWASMGKGVKSVLDYDLTEERCTVVKLDDFVFENAISAIDFIKCDVEGAEKLVIEGAKSTLINNKPSLMLEIGDKWSAHFNYTRIDLIKFLMEHFKYRCFGITNDSIIEIGDSGEVHRYPEDTMYNYFFIHPERSSSISIMENSMGK